MGERRESKKRETRQRISDVATGLFMRRGFEDVTLEEIAAGADVSKVTVLNYFTRKEDLMLDRQDDLKLSFFRDAIRARPSSQSAITALRLVMDELQSQKSALVRFDRHTASWWRLLKSSPALEARLHELHDEAIDELAQALDGATPNRLARLAAGMIVVTVRTAREEGFRVIMASGSAKKASDVFADVIERGFAAVEALAANGGALGKAFA